MSNVTLSIGGREYAVACAEGEEAHVTGLGRLIDAKLATMGGGSGQAEIRSLLFAALLLDEKVTPTMIAFAVAVVVTVAIGRRMPVRRA